MIFVFCLRKQANKQTNDERKPIFLFEPHLGVAYTGEGDSLQYIFILQEEKREGLEVLLCLLCAATKTFAN